MIISPPILKPNTNQTDDAWIKSTMPVGSPANEYPVLDTLAWHGGYHQLASGNENVARAIADGKVVYARKEFDPVDYDGTKSHKGCVVVEHETEIGNNVSIKYYSIYMHLRQIEAGVDKGRKIFRKSKIGLVGQHQNENKMHFEIVCDQANLAKIIGRSTPELSLGADGRKDVVFGDIHFYLPPSTKFYSDANTTTEVYTSTTPLFVSLNFRSGKAYTQTYRELGNGIFQKQSKDPLLVKYKLSSKDNTESENYEYDLHRFSKRFVTSAISQSAVYELFKFGRILDPANETSNISTIGHWHKVPLPDNKVGYVNLNTTAIKKFSDGDFPHWIGWRLFNDDPTPDSQCNSPLLKKWLDVNGDGKSTQADLKAGLGNADLKDRLSRAICQFPTEWSESLVETQYSWVMKKSDENPNPLTADDFAKFKTYVSALSFWDKVPELPEKNRVWHFHPREFIRQFRKCGWLSWSEVKRIYKNTDDAILKEYIPSFNIMSRKYGFATPLRLCHLLGQGAIESAFMKTMQEAAMSGTETAGKVYGKAVIADSKKREDAFGHWWGFTQSERVAWFGSTKYNSKGGLIASTYNWRAGNLDDPDAQKYRGRGFKQLTGRTNYVNYWVYRGWLDKSTFDDSWWSDAQYKARNKAGMKKRAGEVPNPEVVGIKPFNCMDSGGWYMTFERPTVGKTIDGDIPYLAESATDKKKESDLSRAVTYSINGGYIDWEGRLRETRNAKQILLDGV